MASQLAAMMTNDELARQVGVPIQFPAQSLRGVMLNCGAYDLYTAPGTGFPAIDTLHWAYIGQRQYLRTQAADEMSTAKHATSAFPPTYINAGDSDPFESQAYELEAILRREGVSVTSRHWTWSGRKLPHLYHYDVETEPGQVVLKDMIDFVRGRTS